MKHVYTENDYVLDAFNNSGCDHHILKNYIFIYKYTKQNIYNIVYTYTHKML